MAIRTATAPGSNPSSKTDGRVVRLVRPTSTTAPGKMLITLTRHGKTETSSYFIIEQPTELGGRAFRVSKVGSEVSADGRGLSFAVTENYSVLLDGQQSSCECLGFLRWGNRKPCRHIASLLMLASLGKLDAPEPEMECQTA